MREAAMRLRRFLLFGGDRYYPLGGFSDFQGDYLTLEEAVTRAANRAWDWWHVWDMQKKEVVLGGGRDG